MTEEEFEEMLDRIEPANARMRDMGRGPLPQRLAIICAQLFIDESRGTAQERQLIREQMKNLTDPGYFIFEKPNEQIN